MGVVNILNAATPGHGSPPGMTKAGREDNDPLLEVEFIEALFTRVDCWALLLLVLDFLLRSSSDEAS